MSARIEEIRAENYQGDVSGVDIEWLCRVAEAAERLVESVGEHELDNLDDAYLLTGLRRCLDSRIVWDGRCGQWVAKPL